MIRQFRLLATRKAGAIGVLCSSVLITAASFGQNVKVTGTPSVPIPSGATARDGMSRPIRFSDAKGQEFVVSYDAQGRLISVRRATRPGALDIRAIRYLPDGRVTHVLFGMGYQLSFNYYADGSREARDSLDNVVRNPPFDATQRPAIAAVNDPENILTSRLTQFDELLAAIDSAAVQEFVSPPK
jgi:YD repeat-containing protein